MTRPWHIDAMVALFALFWAAWSFALIQQYGPSLAVIAPSIIIAVLGVIMLYGHRISYLQIGNYLLVELDTPRSSESVEESDGKQK